MRTLLVLPLFLSFSALACPNLAGNYQTCESLPGMVNFTSELIIEQKIINKIHNFTVTSREPYGDEVRIEKYKADGKTKIVTEDDPDTGIRMRTETTAKCSGDALTLKIIATVDGEGLANINVNISKQGNQLKQVYTGQSMGEPFEDVVICE